MISTGIAELRRSLSDHFDGVGGLRFFVTPRLMGAILSGLVRCPSGRRDQYSTAHGEGVNL